MKPAEYAGKVLMVTGSYKSAVRALRAAERREKRERRARRGC